ncbi:hypothetical protein EI200_04595 [Peribacillus simplex]|uniref:hypothetical protein n=1 Tax=Peribacillus simplex TaxID=1478 RepID=UPI000F63FB31|nr:hypothetical protein [Peribacillus simplex]RRN73959.1 hypothetical protein EI200_04595 [Peribacillus simplex]
MFWKVYFWALIAISIASMFVETVNGPVLETTDTVISIISTIGLYGYVYKKQFLSKSFWKFIFIITVIEMPVYIMLDVLNDPELGVGGIIFVAAFTLAIMYPFLLGLYRYGFRKQNLA